MKTKKEKLVWILNACREAGLRKTRALQDVLSAFIEAENPLTLPQLTENPALKEFYDQATLYRLLTRLENKGLLQRLGLHNRAAHYTLRWPEEHDDYLVCTKCGTIERLDIACPVHALEKQIGENFGFRDIHHELEFFGVCPKCV